MDNRDAFRQHVMKSLAMIENGIDGTTGFTDVSQNHKKHSFGWKSALNRKILKRMARFKDWHKLIDRVKAMPWKTIGWVLLCSGVFGGCVAGTVLSMGTGAPLFAVFIAVVIWAREDLK